MQRRTRCPPRDLEPATPTAQRQQFLVVAVAVVFATIPPAARSRPQSAKRGRSIQATAWRGGKLEKTGGKDKGVGVSRLEPRSSSGVVEVYPARLPVARIPFGPMPNPVRSRPALPRTRTGENEKRTKPPIMSAARVEKRMHVRRNGRRVRPSLPSRPTSQRARRGRCEQRVSRTRRGTTGSGHCCWTADICGKPAEPPATSLHRSLPPRRGKPHSPAAGTSRRAQGKDRAGGVLCRTGGGYICMQSIALLDICTSAAPTAQSRDLMPSRAPSGPLRRTNPLRGRRA